MNDKNEFESWGDFLSLASRLEVGDGFTIPYVFRGQERARWRLETTLQRAATRNGSQPLPDSEELVRLEGLAHQRFEASAPSLLPGAVYATTNIRFEWWSLMQHYGAPTRLLDWSVSPFVAAYFACRSAPDEAGALYLLHVKSLNDKMKERYGAASAAPKAIAEADRRFRDPSAAPVIYITRRDKALPDRMLAQNGVSLFSGDPGSDIQSELEEVLPIDEQEEVLKFRKLIFPVGVKPDVIRGLRAMNITAETLFPGMEGIGRSTWELVHWR